MVNYRNILMEIKGASHIISIPIEEFGSITELDNFVKKMNRHKVGVAMHHEQSNFHQGVLVQIYDKETCAFKNYLLGEREDAG